MKTLVLVLFLLLSFGCISQTLAQTSEADALAAIDNAESFLQGVYVTVANAQTAGANITPLKAKLGYAGDLLATAHASFRAGNFSNAHYFALLANESIQNVEDDALRLAIAAREDRAQRLSLSVLESSIGVSLAISVVLVGWVYFKRGYVRRVLNQKPEVRQDES